MNKLGKPQRLSVSQTAINSRLYTNYQGTRYNIIAKENKHTEHVKTSESHIHRIFFNLKPLAKFFLFGRLVKSLVTPT